jgi:hypothetical protein
VAKEVVCVTTMKQMILALSSLHHGAAALLTNLVHQPPPLSNYSKTWQALYADGLSNGIHSGPLHPLFVGKNFHDLVWCLYCEFQVLLIGLRYRLPSSDGERDVDLLNPSAPYTIPSVQIARECIFIAQSIEDVVDIEHMSATHFLAAWNRWVVQSELLTASPLPISSMFSTTNAKETSCNCKCKVKQEATPITNTPTKSAAPDSGHETPFHLRQRSQTSIEPGDVHHVDTKSNVRYSSEKRCRTMVTTVILNVQRLERRPTGSFKPL